MVLRHTWRVRECIFGTLIYLPMKEWKNHQFWVVHLRKLKLTFTIWKEHLPLFMIFIASITTSAFPSAYLFLFFLWLHLNFTFERNSFILDAFWSIVIIDFLSAFVRHLKILELSIYYFDMMRFANWRRGWVESLRFDSCI